MKDAEKTIGNMIDKQTVSFIASIDEDGFPNMKAMLQPRKREGIKIIYFTTNTSSMRVVQYRKNDHASVYFCDRRFFRGVMLRGTMEVLTDSASKEMIWREGDTMYYPEGVTDPDYCVLKFTAFSGIRNRLFPIHRFATSHQEMNVRFRKTSVCFPEMNVRFIKTDACFSGFTCKSIGLPFHGARSFSVRKRVKQTSSSFKKVFSFLKDELVCFQPDGIVPES